MKNKLTLIFGLIALIFIWQACEFVKVEDPELDLTKQYQPEYVISGTVIADNDMPVLGAEVRIGESVVFTDVNGNYTFKSNEIPANGTMIEVIQDGFVRSNAKFSYNEKEQKPNVCYYDFTLTQKVNPHEITASQGGSVQIGDITVEIPGNNHFTVNGTEVNSINLRVTPISMYSTLGETPIELVTLKAFSFEPDGAVFSIPIKVSFTAPEGLESTNELQYLVLNESSNFWEAQTNQVKYDEVSNRITVDVYHFSSGKVINPASIHYEVRDVFAQFLETVCVGTCDCEGPQVFEFDYPYIRQLTKTGTATWNELLWANILNANYIPYNPSLLAGIPSNLHLGPIALGNCEQYCWNVYRLMKKVAGWFVVNGEVKTFDIRYYLGAAAAGSYSECDVWTGCHQGCP